MSTNSNRKRTSEYCAWFSMKNRCYNQNYRNSINYMGRGITVCDEWRNSFKSFYDYIGDKPTPSHSLDRINNDGNYEPGNMRWATSKEQANNRRSSNSYKIEGISRIKLGSNTYWSLFTLVENKPKYIEIYKNLPDAINKLRRINKKA